MDLAQAPGVQINTALVLFTELGPDFVARFATAKCFASWLGLCPDNHLTGGKILSSKTREVKSRSAEALRLAAQSLWRAKTIWAIASADGRRGWALPKPSPPWPTS